MYEEETHRERPREKRTFGTRGKAGGSEKKTEKAVASHYKGQKGREGEREEFRSAYPMQ